MLSKFIRSTFFFFDFNPSGHIYTLFTKQKTHWKIIIFLLLVIVREMYFCDQKTTILIITITL